MKIGELFVELFFKSDQTKLTDFISKIGSLNVSSIATALGLGAVYDMTKKIMEQTDQTVVSVNRFSKVTGQSGKDLQQWSSAARQAGLNGDIVASSIEGLQNTLTTLQFTGEGSNILGNILGIDPKTLDTDVFKSLSRILERVTTRIKPQYQTKILADLGLSSDLLVLYKMQDVWKDIGNQLYLNAEQIKRGMEAHKEMSKAADQWKVILADVYTSVITPIASKLNEIASRTTSGARESNVYKDIGEGSGNIAAWLMDSLDKTLNWFWNLPETVGKMNEGPIPFLAGMPNRDSNKSTVNNINNNYNIRGENPKEIAREISEITKRERNESDNQFSARNR